MDAPSCTTLPNHDKQIPTLSSPKNKNKMKDLKKLKIQIIGRDSSLRMVYSNRRLSTRTQASYQGWFPNETTVRNINYLIEPLATALFKDHFS
jgi:hypothetical protein